MTAFVESPRSPIKVVVLAVVVAAAVIICSFVPRIPQDELYHEFADQRMMFGIPNFWNTVTNLPFLLVGLAGLRICLPQVPRGGLRELQYVYATFFAGVTLIALGSAYYHLHPTTAALLWDRLPITVAFLAFFCAVVGESISPLWGGRLLAPLLVAGAASVVYWSVTESRELGDLRPYVLVQFLPMLLIPLVLWMYGSTLTRSGYVWAILMTYALAKAAEFFDGALLEATGIFSGHSIKHLLSGLAALWMAMALVKRRPKAPP